MSTTAGNHAAVEARSKLLARRTALNRIQRSNESDGALLQGAGARERASSEDLASVLATLSDHERKEVDAIDAALIRLDNGTWGHCQSCRAKIASSRLTAIPETETCLDCASQAAVARG